MQNSHQVRWLFLIAAGSLATQQEGIVSNIGPIVYAHAISNPNWIGIHAVQRYETRILVCSRREGQNIFVFSEKPDSDYLKYRSEYLGYDDVDETILVPNAQGTHLAERIMNDPAIIKTLREMVPQGTEFDTFTIGPDEEKLAQTLGFKIIGRAANEIHGSKSRFRQIVREAGYSVSPGFECLASPDDVISAAEALFDAGAREIVVKGDLGASSAQNERFRNSNGWKYQIGEFCTEIEFRSGVVEQWVEDTEASPSTHYELNGQGRPIQQPGPWQQVLKGRRQIYKGAKYPALVSKGMAREIRRQGYDIACRYYDLGVQGPLGFDSILKNGEIIWEEANLRKGGVTFIRDFAVRQGVLDKIVWGLDLENERLKRYSFKRVLKKAKPLLFSSSDTHRTQEGIVLYNVGCLAEGKIQVIIVANNIQNAEYYWTWLQKVLFDLP